MRCRPLRKGSDTAVHLNTLKWDCRRKNSCLRDYPAINDGRSCLDLALIKMEPPSSGTRAPEHFSLDACSQTLGSFINAPM